LQVHRNTLVPKGSHTIVPRFEAETKSEVAQRRLPDGAASAKLIDYSVAAMRRHGDDCAFAKRRMRPLD
jgi:hypothetical protein